MSEKEAEIRASLARLDEAVSADRALSQEDLALLRRQLEESHILVREQQDKSKQVHEENEILTRRKDELEQRLAALETEYEELLGEWEPFAQSLDIADALLALTDKAIQDDETHLSANVQDIKVRRLHCPSCSSADSHLSHRTSSRLSTP